MKGSDRAGHASTCFWRIYPLMSVVGTAGGLVVAGLITLFMPKIYESGAIIEVLPLESESLLSQNEESRTHTEGEPDRPGYVIQAAQDIRSRELLGTVVDGIGLARKGLWDRKDAVDALQKNVGVSFIRGSDLISIRVRNPDKAHAREIARSVVNAYAKHRSVLAGVESERRLVKLNQVIRNQYDNVEERRKILATIQGKRKEVQPNRIEWIESDGSDSNEESPGSETSEDAIKRGIGAYEYEDAKKAYKSDLEHLTELKLARRREIITRNDDTVVLHEEPQIPQSPVPPDIALNLFWGGALGFLFSPLLTWCVIRMRANQPSEIRFYPDEEGTFHRLP